MKQDTNLPTSTETSVVEADSSKKKKKPENFWAIVRRQFFRNPQGLAGIVIFGALLFVALFAPLLANNVPLVASYQGHLCFPAAPTYLDAMPVPTGIADWLRKMDFGSNGNFFSEKYPFLEKSWKETIADKELWDEESDWVITPPIYYGYKELDTNLITKDPGTPGTHGIHYLGTDASGRDVMSRLVHGTIISLSVGVVAVSIYVIIGLILGTIAGFFGGWIDILLSRFTEVVICFPSFFLIITIISLLPRSIYNIMIVIGLTSWTGIFRLIRGEIMRIRQLEYSMASVALGAHPIRIMFKHLVPNAVTPIFVAAAFGIASAILTENALSFLGFGVAPPTASWGEIVAQGRNEVNAGKYYLIIAPGVAILFTVTAFNLIGQALRDAMDPKMRN